MQKDVKHANNRKESHRVGRNRNPQTYQTLNKKAIQNKQNRKHKGTNMVPTDKHDFQNIKSKIFKHYDC
jgi:hypothetical protein